MLVKGANGLTSPFYCGTSCLSLDYYHMTICKFVEKPVEPVKPVLRSAKEATTPPTSVWLIKSMVQILEPVK